MKIAIYGKPYDNTLNASVGDLICTMNDAGFEVAIYERYHNHLNKMGLLKGNFTIFNRKTVDIKSFVCLVSVGGDGTLLDTATLIGASGVPIIGLNAGRLGFISSASVDEFEGVLQTLLDGTFQFEERSLLQIETKRNLFGSLNFALNELTVLKKDTAAMIKIDTYYHEEFLNSYWADGLVVSTPTGSTAYSLSCGGPIIMPGSENMVITPIAPHNLSIRPMVVPMSARLKLKISGRSDNFLISLDSRSEVILPDEEVIVSKAPFNLRLLQPEGHTFLNTVRHKLGWGLDKRN